jgi:diacylglycerol kinase (ATP)
MGGREDELKSQKSHIRQISQISQMSQIGHGRTKFSVKARFKSFEYAFAGIRYFLSSQHNAWIHLIGTVVVIFLAVGFHVSRSEAIALTFAVGFVWVSELFNTAIEKIMDFISVEKNPKIKIIKDISAAAVLVAAITALTVGCFVFIPKILLCVGSSL